jgi:hypothetical protein
MITYDQIVRTYSQFPPPRVHLPVDYVAPISEAIQEFRHKVHAKEIVWVLCREEFMPETDLRGFCLWMARQVATLIVDARYLHAIEIARRYLKGDATEEELTEVRDELHNIYAYYDGKIRVSGSVEDVLARVVNQLVSVKPFPYSAACDIGYYLRGTPLGDSPWSTALVAKLLAYFESRERGEAFEWWEYI